MKAVQSKTNIDKLQESLEKGNFWKEYDNAGKEAYRKCWKEHKTANVLGFLYAVINKIILAFFSYSLILFTWAFIIIVYTDGTMTSINNLQLILSEIKSPEDLSVLFHIWIYTSLFFLMLSLVFEPIKTKAQTESERKKSIFMDDFGKYMPIISNKEKTF